MGAGGQGPEGSQRAEPPPAQQDKGNGRHDGPRKRAWERALRAARQNAYRAHDRERERDERDVESQQPDIKDGKRDGHDDAGDSPSAGVRAGRHPAGEESDRNEHRE